MDLSKVDKYGLTHDLVKVALFNLCAMAAMHYGYGQPLLSQQFLYQLFFILAGFTLFYVFLEPHIKKYWTEPAKAAKTA